MITDLNKLQKILLNMVNDFSEACEKNNLKYFMIGGTLLGAIRHHGFIPWDDDIDIGMPRTDYDKFISKADTILPNYLTISNSGINNRKNEFLFVKLYHKGTTLIEKPEGDLFERIGGIYIDIFPVDGAGNSKLYAVVKMKILAILRKILLYSSICIEHKRHKIYIKCKIAQILNNKFIFILANNLLKINKLENSKYSANFLGSWGKREIVRTNCFDELIKLRFENIELFGIARYDKYLSNIYGEYMKFPPKEKQISHHGFKYINYDIGYEKFYFTKEPE